MTAPRSSSVLRCSLPPLDGAVYLQPRQVDVFCNNAGINVNWGWRRCMDVNIVSRSGEERVVGDEDVRCINAHPESFDDDVSNDTFKLSLLISLPPLHE